MKIPNFLNNLNTSGFEKLSLETLYMYNKRSMTVDLLVLNGTRYPFLKKLKYISE